MAGRHRISIGVARIFIDLASPLSSTELGIESWRLWRCRAEGEPEKPLARVAVRWEESERAPVPRGELIYDPGSTWKMYRAERNCLAALTYHPNGLMSQAQSVLCANPAWDDLTLTEQRIGALWRSSLDNGASDLILRTSILLTGGLMFHSSGLDDNGRGIVFIGHSGAGKSTQLCLWSQERGVIAMNDDRIAVRVEERGPRCYGTPWGGSIDITRNHAAPLAAIIVLGQAPATSIQPLAPAAAAPLLAVRSFLPFWDRSMMSRAMANLSAILESVPVYHLRCRPEKETVIPLVRSVL